MIGRVIDVNANLGSLSKKGARSASGSEYSVQFAIINTLGSGRVMNDNIAVRGIIRCMVVSTFRISYILKRQYSVQLCTLDWLI